MPTSLARPTRSRRLLVVLLAMSLTMMALPARQAQAAEASSLEAIAENLFHQRHIQTRQDPATNGVTDYPTAPLIDGRTDLLQTARAWSAQMAAADELKHNPNLADDVCCWRRVGENVAYFRGDLTTEEQVKQATERLMNAWIGSGGHRRNIMDAEWSDFAVGVVIANGAMWATGVFRTLDGTTTPSGTSYGANGPHATAAPRETTSTDPSEPGTTEPSSEPTATEEPATSSEPTATPVARDTTETCAEVDDDGFADARGTAHESTITCAAGHGLANGRSDGSYQPNGSVTRGQVMTFLRRAVEKSGYVLDENAPDAFSDDNGTAHEQSANMLAAAGFVEVGNGKLQPNAKATRGFIANVTGRAVKAIARVTPSADYFADDNGDANEGWINTLAEAGVVTGSKGKYGPELGLTRGQMATVLVRAFDTMRAA